MSEQELPEGWAETTLADAAVVSGGLTKNASQRNASTKRCPLVSVAAVRSGWIDPDEVGEIGLLEEDGNRAELKFGDVLIVEGNGSLSHIGRAAIWNLDLAGARHQNHIIRVRPKAVSPELLLAWLTSGSGRTQIVDKATSAAGLYTLSLSKVGSLNVPVPPLNEQRRIVVKLEDLLARSRRAKHALDAVPPLLEKLRQSILASAFRGDLTADFRAQHPDLEPASELLKRIRLERRKKWEEAELNKLKAKGKLPSDDRWKQKYQEPEPVDTSELPELPEGWCWASWAEVGFSQNGRAFPSTEYRETGVPLLRPGNLHVSGRVEWSADNTKCLAENWAMQHPEHLVRGNELVVNLTAQSLKDEFLGRICMTAASDRCLLNQRIGRLSPVVLEPRYVFWIFKSPAFRAYVDKLNTGSLIQHMFTSQIDAYALCIPPLEEQREIAARLDAAAKTWEAIAGTVARAERTIPGLGSSLLAKAFRGELVPQDPGDEPASLMLERLAQERAAGEASAPKRGARKPSAAEPAAKKPTPSKSKRVR